MDLELSRGYAIGLNKPYINSSQEDISHSFTRFSSFSSKYFLMVNKLSDVLYTEF